MNKIFALLLCITAGLMIVLASTPAPAGCRSHCYPQQTYCAPPVLIQPVQQVIQPVVIQERLVPAFVFQVMTAYNPQVQQVAPQTGYAPQIGLQPTYSPQPLANTNPSADMEERIALRVVQILQSSGALKGHTGGNEVGLPILELSPPPKLEAKQGPPINDTANLQRAVNSLYTRCYSCHNVGMTKGDLILFSEKDNQIQWAPYRPSGKAVQKGRIWEMVAWNEQTAPLMPPGADRDPSKRIPLEDLELVRFLDSK